MILNARPGQRLGFLRYPFFGFPIGIGGMVESAPFKLTAEYAEVLDGAGSPVYAKFCEVQTLIT